jgi:dihydrofolate reductase
MKVSMIMLQTVNGKIARNHQDKLRWGGKADKKNFAKLSKQIGTVIMGSSNFEALGSKPLLRRRNIIMTRNPAKYSHIDSNEVEFTDQSPQELCARLANEGLAEVAVIGGGKINLSFFNAGLIDQIYLSIAAKIFTKGIDLIAEDDDLDIDLQLDKVSKLDDNTLLLTYTVNK